MTPLMKDDRWILQSGMYSSWDGVSMCRSFDNWDKISLSPLLFGDTDVLNVFLRLLRKHAALIQTTKFNMQIKQ